MRLRDLVSSALQSLRRTKGRSALTMLGIIIGIMSVILVLSIGESAQRFILGQIQSFGSDLVIILNGPPQGDGVPSAFTTESLTIRDLKALRTKEWVRAIIGAVEQNDEVQANGQITRVKVTGTTPDEIVFYELEPERGVFLQWEDVDERSKVAVLGYEVAVTLFGQTDPLGQVVRINRQNFRVVGVMPRSGTRGFENIDKNVYIPVSSAQDLYNRKYLMAMTFKSAIPVGEAIWRVRDELRDLHNISLGDEDDFNVQTQEDFVKSASEITNILQILLTSIAAISLLVGGIGIMNIMYVTVTERTREIGLRKSIGATNNDIRGQFIVEAMTLTSIGGVVGITLGVFFTWLAIQGISTVQTGWTFQVSTRGVVLGLVVSAVIGLVFGYFPARRAALLNPIEALRRE